MRRTMALKNNLTTNGLNGWRSQVEWRAPVTTSIECRVLVGCAPAVG